MYDLAFGEAFPIEPQEIRQLLCVAPIGLLLGWLLGVDQYDLTTFPLAECIHQPVVESADFKDRHEVGIQLRNLLEERFDLLGPGAPSSNAPKTATSDPTDVPPEKSNRRKGNASPLMLVERRLRQNLTLKVLQENEAKFNQLFLKLQLRGDCRKKQDMADEALELLFSKYKSVLEAK